MRRGRFDYRLAVPRRRLAGQVLGIVGFGDIARALAAKARALGMRVVAHARRAVDEPGVEALPLDDLLRAADYVSLHVPLTAETTGLIGARELALMKPTAFLINTARGAVIDQPALVAALQARRIAGAGLDVMTPEPPATDDPLLALENVILTPHVAWYSEESREHVTREAALDVVRVLRGESPRNAVNPGIRPRFGGSASCTAS
jgi:D-3-phosphoglycerate dehydrogenase